MNKVNFSKFSTVVDNLQGKTKRGVQELNQLHELTMKRFGPDAPSTQQIQEIVTRIEDIPLECYRTYSVRVKQPKSILSKTTRTPLPKD